MKTFACKKEVQAFKISDLDFGLDGVIYLSGVEGDRQAVDFEYAKKHNPKIGGYFVKYDDGYQSWSPADKFEAGYVEKVLTPMAAPVAVSEAPAVVAAPVAQPEQVTVQSAPVATAAPGVVPDQKPA